MKRLLLFLPVVAAAFWAFLHYREQLPQLAGAVRDLGLAGALLLGAVYALATVLLVPASLLTLVIGFLYGPVLGLALVSPASVLGATGAFCLARSVLRAPLQRRFGSDPRFQNMDRAIEAQGMKILILTRLSPLFPFTILNYLFGLTRLSLVSYVLGSFLAMLPGTFLYVYLGSTVEDLSQLGSGVPSGGTAGTVFKIAGLAATLALTLLIARSARRALRAAAPGSGRD